MDNDIFISVNDVRAGYDSKQVLKGVSLGIRKGKITAVLGQNGCGKSTLLKTIIGIVRRTGGNIDIGGAAAETLSARELARNVAYIPQNKNIPDLTVMTMVLHGRFAYLGYPRRYRRKDIKIAENAIKAVGLENVADEKIGKLSGGTQQRVFLAMSLAQCSPAILMDEPTSFLDISNQLKFMRLCRSLADSGKAIAMVIHDLGTAMKYADCVAVMDDGKTVAFGTPEEIYAGGILDRVFGVKVGRAATEDGFVYYF